MHLQATDAISNISSFNGSFHLLHHASSLCLGSKHTPLIDLAAPTNLILEALTTSNEFALLACIALLCN